VVGIAVTVLSGLVFLYAAFEPNPPSGEGDVRVLALVFFGGVALAGLGVARIGFPEMWPRAPRAVLQRATTPSTFRHPVALSLTLYLAGALLALLVPAEIAILTTFVLLCVFAIANPIALASGPRWLWRAALSVVCFVLLLGLLAGTSEALSGRRFGDDAMVLLAPVMLYMLALPASGLFRLVRHFNRKLTN
jgi:hypothetical protein